MESEDLKEIKWVSSSQDDLRELPDEVRATFGYALYEAQMGGKFKNAYPMRGFGGASVLEIIEDDDHNSTYRAVYTVKFKDYIYVLHVFQKKSKKGIATPKPEMDLIKARLKDAEADYAYHLNENKSRRVGHGKKK